jgi:hypothetical protein
MTKKKNQANSPSLFNEEFVPAEPGSGRLFDIEYTARDQPVTCLGMTFKNDQARRTYFIDELRNKLKDPEFRKIEGFPIGEDEDIIKMSDPPYYTACPNPWLADLVAEWESQKPCNPEGGTYHREPFAADVSEGKNDPIYSAHSYHTKVPHKAIMRYILHYTQPGDIVYDGFCGTGMTGVAAQLCGDKDTIQSLGFRVEDDGTILEEEIDDLGEKKSRAFSKLGSRRVILNDLAPAATFIAHNYNSPISPTAFATEAQNILEDVALDCDWMYVTRHTDGSICKVDYYVWSEVFVCPNCAAQLVFSEIALDSETGHVHEDLACSSCESVLKKNDLELAYVEHWDDLLKEPHKSPKRVVYRIAYRKGKEKHLKAPDSEDQELADRIEKLPMPDMPLVAIPDMQMMRVGRMKPSNITHLHHFFLKRPMLALAKIWERANQITEPDLRHKCLFFAEQAIWGMSILARYTPTHFSQVNQYLSGVFYMASHVVDVSPNYILSGKASRLEPVFGSLANSKLPGVISTQDTAKINIPANSLDYAFVDPPFGENIYYSDLNILIESMHRVVTNSKSEAIIDRVKGKDFAEYQRMMTNCFQQIYVSLKPGRWLTVEFSNSSASIWNLIQSSLGEAGFVVSNVSALDKKQRSFQSVTSPIAVKQDLVISAYKPNGGFEERFPSEAHTAEGVWDFIRSHLRYLPVTKFQGAKLQTIPERDPRILFDQMISYYVRKGYPVPISSSEFQIGLAQNFIERDGMYFLTEQIAEYDRRKAISGQVQQAMLFVSDEASAIQWLRQFLKDRPQSFSDINPHFMQQLGGWSKNEQQLDLRELLNQSFLCYEGKGPVPEQIHAYLSSNWKDMRNLSKEDPQLVAKAKDRWYIPDPNKVGDLEKLRERALLKEFEEYKQLKRKFKASDRFRLEAVRAGFKKAWQDRDYKTILAVGEKLPSQILEEDPKLLMWYDQAVTRSGGGA